MNRVQALEEKIEERGSGSGVTPKFVEGYDLLATYCPTIIFTFVITNFDAKAHKVVARLPKWAKHCIQIACILKVKT